MTLSNAHPAPRWDHLGRRLELARGRTSRAEVARQTGISYSAIKQIERGPWPPNRTDPTPTMRELAAHYGWTPDSIDDVLTGGEPTQIATMGDVYRAVAAGATSDEQSEIMRGIWASNLPEDLKSKLTKLILG
jgi:transcriptional regulator with XRE-family HTH domain